MWWSKIPSSLDHLLIWYTFKWWIILKALFYLYANSINWPCLSYATASAPQSTLNSVETPIHSEVSCHHRLSYAILLLSYRSSSPILPWIQKSKDPSRDSSFLSNLRTGSHFYPHSSLNHLFHIPLLAFAQYNLCHFILCYDCRIIHKIQCKYFLFHHYNTQKFTFLMRFS